MSITIEFAINKRSKELLCLFATEAAKLLPPEKQFTIEKSPNVGSRRATRTSKIVVDKKVKLLEQMRYFLQDAKVKKMRSAQIGVRTYEVEKANIFSTEMAWLTQATETLSRWKAAPIERISMQDNQGNIAAMRSGKLLTCGQSKRATASELAFV